MKLKSNPNHLTAFLFFVACKLEIALNLLFRIWSFVSWKLEFPLNFLILNFEFMV